MAKILVVDDEEDITTALSIRLKSLGYEVITAVDGLQALDLARKEHPDLILLDIMLPKLDGYKVCRMLKFDEKYKDIPIIMVTAKGADSEKQTGQDVGADAYFTKPIKTDLLIAKIKEILDKKPAK